MTTRLLDLLLMSCWCSCWCHQVAWSHDNPVARSPADVMLLGLDLDAISWGFFPNRAASVVTEPRITTFDFYSQSIHIWSTSDVHALLFTINTYLIQPPSSKSVSEPQSVREKGVAPDWCRTRAAKCLDLMRAGNRDKCSMIRGNRKTRWISAEDLLCVNTKIYHPTKRSGEVFVSLFIWNLFIKVPATAQLSYACWDDEAFYSGGTLSNVPLWSRQGKCY